MVVSSLCVLSTPKLMNFVVFGLGFFFRAAGCFPWMLSAGCSEICVRFGGIAPGLHFGSDRRRSFPGDCTPIHPFVNTALLQGQPGRHGRRPRTCLFFATIPPDQARFNHQIVDQGYARSIERPHQAGQGPRGAWPKPCSIQSLLSLLNCSFVAYQGSIQGTSIPNALHNPTAAS